MPIGNQFSNRIDYGQVKKTAMSSFLSWSRSGWSSDSSSQYSGSLYSPPDSPAMNPATTIETQAVAKFYQEEYIWTIEGISKTFPNVYIPEEVSSDSYDDYQKFAPILERRRLTTGRKYLDLRLGSVVTTGRVCEMKIWPVRRGDGKRSVFLCGRLDLLEGDLERVTDMDQFVLSAGLINLRGDTVFELAPPEEADIDQLRNSEHANSENEDVAQRFTFDLMYYQDLWLNKQTYFPDDVLRLKIAFTIFDNDSEKVGARTLEPDPWAPERLSKDMMELLTSKEGSDVNIVCGSVTFSAHESILKVRSPVLRAALDSNMIEKATRTIKIEDIEHEVFGKLLKYIYSSKVEFSQMSNEMICQLIYGAEKYELVDLRDLCFRYLSENITMKSAGLIAVTAYTYSAPKDFSEKILKYCAKHWLELSRLPEFQASNLKCPQAFWEKNE